MASSFHDYMGEPSTLFDSFLFDNLGLMPLSVSLLLPLKLITHSVIQGNLVGVDPIDFIGYLALGLGPTLYPLYASVYFSSIYISFLIEILVSNDVA
jgi:hypothetical protein